MTAVTIEVRIREHRTDVLDEDGTVTLSATVTTRAAAARWLQRHLALVDLTTVDAVGEATEYEDDPLDGLVPVATGHLSSVHDRVEWWSR